MRDAWWEEQGFAPEQVEALMPTAESRVCRRRPPFDEKSVVDSFYVVLEGEVEISRLDGAAEIPLGTHGPGEFTGGLVLLTGGPRSTGRGRRAEPRSGDRLGDAGACPPRSLTWPTSSSRAWPGACATPAGLPPAGEARGPGQALGRPGPRAEWSPAAARRAQKMVEGNPRGPTHLLGHDERFSAKEREALVALQRETAAGNADFSTRSL